MHSPTRTLTTVLLSSAVSFAIVFALGHLFLWAAGR
jgi:hypothetical protein